MVVIVVVFNNVFAIVKCCKCRCCQVLAHEKFSIDHVSNNTKVLEFLDELRARNIGPSGLQAIMHANQFIVVSVGKIEAWSSRNGRQRPRFRVRRLDC